MQHPIHATRRHFLGQLAGGAVLACGATPSWAQAGGWQPQRSMRIIVPSTPGGISDTLARVVAEHLSTSWGKPCVVENKPGGGGITGSQELLRHPADGHTLLTCSPGPQATAYSLFPKLPYKEGDFAAVSGMVKMPNVLVIHPSVPAYTVSEFVAYARANPNKLNYGGPIGSSLHLSGLWFNQLTRTRATHIPYPGSAQAGAALLSGEIQFMFDNLASYVQHVRSGKIRALGVSTAERSALLPDVVTVNSTMPELAEFEVATWVGLVTAAGAPPEALAAINLKVREALAKPAAIDRINAVAGRADWQPVDKYDAFVKSEVRRWSGIIKRAGLQLEIT
ncbi:Bug family tripartite tricarboxylate transporter substrate binding protein [Ramlibacter sp.]|uniref:Bug family tripartite tricarboxylate transporter substrate binding protein n=1 Tax=Ramlibacter sp. TaxID=1917967 RepID=UPI003D0B399F